jgi:NitT/TauT family transport system permease protein
VSNTGVSPEVVGQIPAAAHEHENGAVREARTARRSGARSRINFEGIGALLSVAIAWQIASHFFPPFLFPPLEVIGATLAAMLTDPEMLRAIGLTFIRIVVSLTATFILATALGVLAAIHARTDRVLEPLIQIKQGVPGVCWIIFAILWFSELETRIAFVVIISTLPAFYYQARDGVRGISPELWQMVRAWRPTRLQMLTKLILPALRPTLLTAWRINLGGGTRMVIMAELLSGVSGIGYQLRTAQEQFRMDSAIAWTVVMVAFVLVCDRVLRAIEVHLWRGRDAPVQGS